MYYTSIKRTQMTTYATDIFPFTAVQAKPYMVVI